VGDDTIYGPPGIAAMVGHLSTFSTPGRAWSVACSKRREPECRCWCPNARHQAVAKGTNIDTIPAVSR
jgi:hypothetical protein